MIESRNQWDKRIRNRIPNGQVMTHASDHSQIGRPISSTIERLLIAANPPTYIQINIRASSFSKTSAFFPPLSHGSRISPETQALGVAKTWAYGPPNTKLDQPLEYHCNIPITILHWSAQNLEEDDPFSPSNRSPLVLFIDHTNRSPYPSTFLHFLFLSSLPLTCSWFAFFKIRPLQLTPPLTTSMYPYPFSLTIQFVSSYCNVLEHPMDLHNPCHPRNLGDVFALDPKSITYLANENIWYLTHFY